MPILDVVLGRSVSLDDAEEELGRPDKAEATDLALHVDRCGKRWALSYRASKNNSAQLAQVRIFLVALCVIEVARSPEASKIFAAIGGWLK